MNKVIDSMLAHRSIRSYTDRTVSDEDLNSIIRAVQAAPNWVNLQLVSIIAVKNTDHRRRLAELCGNQVHIAEAPVFLVFCTDYHRVALACHKKEQTLDEVMQDIDTLLVGAHEVGIALEAAVVAAESLGLGTVPIGDVLPLVMGYKYFKDKRYLDSAKRTADYLEKELISKADYFSSTLDANCEDKEASLYAATATYYLSLVTKGEEHKHYADLTKQAAYFALSWYYLWDVPFAPGQMLGDIGLKTRGWGNVSVENNHIDVFVFEFADVLRWLSNEYKESRFSNFAEVISTSMRQLLPYEGHMCGIAKVGYYPEVVQHTSWDYGKNGKGYYNDIFAPGWTVASLWELFTPGRAEIFMER